VVAHDDYRRRQIISGEAQLKANLYKLVNVLLVENITNQPAIVRDLAMIRVAAGARGRGRMCCNWRACSGARGRCRSRIVDHRNYWRRRIRSTDCSNCCVPYGILEMVRTGIVAMRRGSKSGEASALIGIMPLRIPALRMMMFLTPVLSEVCFQAPGSMRRSAAWRPIRVVPSANTSKRCIAMRLQPGPKSRAQLVFSATLQIPALTSYVLPNNVDSAANGRTAGGQPFSSKCIEEKIGLRGARGPPQHTPLREELLWFGVPKQVWEGGRRWEREPFAY